MKKTIIRSSGSKTIKKETNIVFEGKIGDGVKSDVKVTVNNAFTCVVDMKTKGFETISFISNDIDLIKRVTSHRTVTASITNDILRAVAEYIDKRS